MKGKHNLKVNSLTLIKKMHLNIYLNIRLAKKKQKKKTSWGVP